MKRNSWRENSVAALLERVPVPGLAGTLQAARDDGTLPIDQLTECLSEAERARAQLIADADELRHFMLRRSLQRVFVAQMIGWRGALTDLDLRHGLDQRPFCPAAPQLCLSFSSAAGSYLLAAAENADLGVDIERLRPVEQAAALAARFFSPEEAAAVADTPPKGRDLLFLTLWSGKEAGLKAKGRGIVSGLNSFTFENQQGFWHIRDHDAADMQGGWQFFLPHWRDGHIVAVMHRPAD